MMTEGRIIGGVYRMQDMITGRDSSVLNEVDTKGLGYFTFHHPTGTFALTPASNILIQAIIDNQELLQGIGIDWGSGVGCLAILAAKIKTVNRVYGLEISAENVHAARRNADINGVRDKVSFMRSDSYLPFDGKDRQILEGIRGNVNFILANPPSSEGDDGFEFRRIVLRGAKEFLCRNGIVLLNISFQYGEKRIKALYENIHGYHYIGVAASTACVPFDLNRPDLLECLKVYQQEELKGGSDYTFIADGDSETLTEYINAQTAWAWYDKCGKSPQTKWQTHVFKYIG